MHKKAEDLINLEKKYFFNQALVKETEPTISLTLI